MDFPVEATVHLSVFPDKTQAREILKSHGFVLTDQGGDRVRVKGSFLMLKDVKTTLEKLQKEDLRPSSPSAVQKVSSGAISKQRNFTSTSSSSSFSNKHPSSPINNTSSYSSSSPRPEFHSSSSSGKESFLVDADVLEYTVLLRKRDIDDIVDSHNVTMSVVPMGESCSIALKGRRARAAVAELQSLLDDLSRSLRTQEVSLKDMDGEGRALLERIKRNRNVHNLVLVRQTEGKLHLVGPSRESFLLKQRLLGNPAQQSGRTGRTQDRSQRGRSSSEPPKPRKSEERGRRAAASPSPVRAAGYSSKKERNVSEWQPRSAVERLDDTRNKSAVRGITQLLQFNPTDIRRKLKKLGKGAQV